MKQNTLRLVWFALIFLLVAWLNLSLFGYAEDDAYIHFRIAENFLLHGAPYYNPAEPVMGSSSSGWTILLFILFSIFGTGLKSVAVLNALATSLCAYVYSGIARRLTSNDGIFVDIAASAVCVMVLVYSSVALMETPVAMLLLGAGILLHMDKRPAAFALLAAAVFFRLELAAFLAVFAAHAVIRKTMPPGRALLFALLGAAPFVPYNMYFFDSHIPQTVFAKGLVYSISLERAINASTSFLSFNGWYVRLAVIALYLSLCAAAVRGVLKRFPGAETLLLLSVSSYVVLFAYLAADTMIFQWYIPIYALPVLISLTAYAIMNRSAIFRLSLLAVLAPVVYWFAFTAYAAGWSAAAFPYFLSGARTAKYLDLGKRIYREYPGASLMSSEIGGLGYAFKGYIYDACGLVSEDALKHHPMKVPEQRPNGSIGAIPPGYVREVKPDIIVSYDVFDEALVASDALDDYVTLREKIFTREDMHISGSREIWGSRGLNIHIRRDLYEKSG